MCGIAGFTGPARPHVLRAMCDALVHRGPDGSGEASPSSPGWDTPVVHLGHRRLSIVDLEAGAQPMSTGDGRWHITFNGEIYGFAAVRSELRRAGHEFRTRSDTEVLLVSLAAHGAAALPQLDGMFAFAAYDAHERRLILAVDRFGQKPLVWHRTGDGRLVFASELTALVAHPDVPTELDPTAIARSLAFNAPPSPTTIYSGVHRLPPGSVLTATVDEAGGVRDLRVEAWWRPEYATAGAVAAGSSEFGEALRESVRTHMVADVPVGVLLSGGIDSTAVACAATAERPVHTISMGFAERTYDESSTAEETARRLGTQHRRVELSAGNAVDTLSRVSSHLDEPLLDAGCLPAWHLFRAVREHVTVAVGGDGGDELLRGYPTFQALELSRRLSGLGAPLPARVLGGLAGLLPVGEGYYPLGYQARRFVAGLRAAPWWRAHAYLGACSPRRIRSLMRSEHLADLPADERGFAEALMEPARPSRDRLPDSTDGPNLWADMHLRGYLAGEVLRKVDRMSMAHSLEVRAPMLGRPFAELALRTPETALRRGRKGKLPLRAWLRDESLEHVLDHPKRGFTIPVSTWLRNDLRPTCDELFLDPTSPLMAWVQPDSLATLWVRHRDRRDDHRKELWGLLALGAWLRAHG